MVAKEFCGFARTQAKWCMYSGILLRHEKDEIVPFAATWMDLEMIILCKASQKEKDKYMISLLYGI